MGRSVVSGYTSSLWLWLLERFLEILHNNKQAMFGFSQRKCPWPAVLHRKSSEMHVMPKEVLFWEYLVISSKLLPNSGTAYNFYVNSAHCLSHAMFLSLLKMCHPLRKQRRWLYKIGSHPKLLEGKVTLFNGVGLFR